MKRTPLKKSGWKRKTYQEALLAHSQKPYKARSKKKAKKTPRAKKMGLKKLLCEIYSLPNVPCARWGTGKKPTRQDILKGMLWYVFSRWIRQRDKGVCIACGLFKTYEELQAGHFAPAGGNDLELCFDEHNVNGECEGCNGDFVGTGWHLIEMRKNLIVKFGVEEVELIETLKAQKRATKWEELEYAIKIRDYHERLSTRD